MLGLVGTKKGMTRVFKDDGASVPVTVIEVCKSKIVQRKTVEKDGYYAIQVTYGSKKSVSKSNQKKFEDLETDGGYLTEFSLTEEEYNSLSEVSEISLGCIESPSVVDVSGISKGKGFAGVVKRHNFKTQDATHGNSLSHRAPGSIGQCQFPGRVFKGKKMAGQMGNKKVTIQNLEIERLDTDDNILLVKGAVPGSIGSFLKILPSIKNNNNELFVVSDKPEQKDDQNVQASGENLNPGVEEEVNTVSEEVSKEDTVAETGTEDTEKKETAPQESPQDTKDQDVAGQEALEEDHKGKEDA
ncbi:MAG: 50S ribosomal protein L3 [SAR86 cluster bacterium]|uniref:Large ribosomal subunit protein uL3 n=1 Tax=SAR86 cluster bacterium TaxID=2030880 RepID=A0A937I7W1_9GAMM|nr:50S ribosomal protein L3 [SAR86 cluster bacterium]